MRPSRRGDPKTRIGNTDKLGDFCRRISKCTKNRKRKQVIDRNEFAEEWDKSLEGRNKNGGGEHNLENLFGGYDRDGNREQAEVKQVHNSIGGCQLGNHKCKLARGIGDLVKKSGNFRAINARIGGSRNKKRITSKAALQ